MDEIKPKPKPKPNPDDNYKIDKFVIATYIIIIFSTIFITRQIAAASKDKKAFTTNLYYNLAMIIFPLIVLLAVVLYISFSQKFAAVTLVGTIMGCIIIFAFIYFMKTNFSKYFFNVYLLYALIGLFILIGLAILFIIFTGKLRKVGGWTGFFANLLFYIPCMIQNGIRSVINEYNSSSTTMIILFAMEILIILMYLFAIPMVNQKSFPEKIVLQDDPIMLNTKLFMDNKLTEKTAVSSAISFWVYLNPSPDTKMSYSSVVPETTILNYSDFKEESPHIKITYSNANKGNNDYIMTIGSKKFRISLPYQKWHYFVVNFVTFDAEVPTVTSGPVPTVPPEKVFDTDIFINGVLERSYSSETAKKDSEKYNINFLDNDILYIGSGSSSISTGNLNTDGLYGAICNVVFHKTPLTRLAIVYKYNMLLLSNPPVE